MLTMISKDWSHCQLKISLLSFVVEYKYWSCRSPNLIRQVKRQISICTHFFVLIFCRLFYSTDVLRCFIDFCMYFHAQYDYVRILFNCFEAREYAFIIVYVILWHIRELAKILSLLYKKGKHKKTNNSCIEWKMLP